MGGEASSFADCLSHLNIEHASLSRRRAGVCGGGERGGETRRQWGAGGRIIGVCCLTETTVH